MIGYNPQNLDEPEHNAILEMQMRQLGERSSD